MIIRLLPSILILAMVIFCCEDDKIEQHKIRYEVKTSLEENESIIVLYTTPSGVDTATALIDESGNWNNNFEEYIFESGEIVKLDILNCSGKVDCTGIIYNDNIEVRSCIGEDETCFYVVP